MIPGETPRAIYGRILGVIYAGTVAAIAVIAEGALQLFAVMPERIPRIISEGVVVTSRTIYEIIPGVIAEKKTFGVIPGETSAVILRKTLGGNPSSNFCRNSRSNL